MYNQLMKKTLGDTISISTARANLPKIVEDAVKYLRRFTITVNGQPQAIVMSQQELDGIEETAEILAIPGALKDIRQGEKEIREGKGIPLEEILKEFKIKR